MPGTPRGKRERLVESAADVLHRDGLEGTTLARVAAAADVPLGNVYYYFKTRDDLIRAVVDHRLAEISNFLTTIDSRGTPRARLKALVRSWSDMADLVAGSGCPVGSLASELAKHDGDLDDCVGAPLRQIVDWTAQQFSELGRRDARSRAVALIGAVQGAALLANAFRDPRLLRSEVRRLERSIDAD